MTQLMLLLIYVSLVTSERLGNLVIKTGLNILSRKLTTKWMDRLICTFDVCMGKKLIMPPTLKKWGAYCFQLVRVSVRACVRPFKKNLKLGF